MRSSNRNHRPKLHFGGLIQPLKSSNASSLHSAPLLLMNQANCQYIRTNTEGEIQNEPKKRPGLQEKEPNDKRNIQNGFLGSKNAFKRFSVENKENFLNSFEIFSFKVEAKQKQREAPKDPMALETLKYKTPLERQPNSTERKVMAVRSVSLKRSKGENGSKIENIRVCIDDRKRSIQNVSQVLTSTEYSFSSGSETGISSRRRALSCRLKNDSERESVRLESSRIEGFVVEKENQKPLETPQSHRRNGSMRRGNAGTRENDEWRFGGEMRSTERSGKECEIKKSGVLEISCKELQEYFQTEKQTSNPISLRSNPQEPVKTSCFPSKNQSPYHSNDVSFRTTSEPSEKPQKLSNPPSTASENHVSDIFMNRISHKYSSLSTKIQDVLFRYKTTQNEPQKTYKSLEESSFSSQTKREFPKKSFPGLQNETPQVINENQWESLRQNPSKSSFNFSLKNSEKCQASNQKDPRIVENEEFSGFCVEQFEDEMDTERILQRVDRTLEACASN